MINEYIIKNKQEGALSLSLSEKECAGGWCHVYCSIVAISGAFWPIPGAACPFFSSIVQPVRRLLSCGEGFSYRRYMDDTFYRIPWLMPPLEALF